MNIVYFFLYYCVEFGTNFCMCISFCIKKFLFIYFLSKGKEKAGICLIRSFPCKSLINRKISPHAKSRGNDLNISTFRPLVNKHR